MKHHKPKHNPYIGFTIPDDLSLEEHEKPSLSQVIYKNKVVTEWRKKSTLQNLYFVYLLIKLNGGLDKKGCSLPIHAFTRLPNPFTGKIIGVGTATAVLTGLLQAGIITSNNHWNKEAKISKIYKVTDKIKTYARMSLHYSSKQESKQLTTTPIMTEDIKDTDLYRDLTKEELDELLGDDVVVEPIRIPKMFTDSQLKRIESIRQKFRNATTCDRYREVNTDPHETHVCMNCDHERPAYMYSLSQEGHLNDQCRGCYELAETEAGDMTEYLLNWVNRETPTQRSIRKLKAQMAELAA